jgi:hypothetical protein
LCGYGLDISEQPLVLTDVFQGIFSEMHEEILIKDFSTDGSSKRR